MTESKPRKNNDYTASAVNLTNHEVYKGMFENLRHWQENKGKLESELKTKNAELYSLLDNCDKEINIVMSDIRLSIDQYGSYQDLERGDYAIKQSTISKSYDAQAFKDNYIKLAPAVIVETVNEKALLGLIKGGLLTEKDLKEKGVTQEAESFRYIIK